MFKRFVIAAIAAGGFAFPAWAQAPAAPACSAAEYRQLDFWVGDWDIEFDAGGGKVGHAANHITGDEYGGCVIAEHFTQPDIGYRGGSYSSFDGQTGRWRQTWVDNQGSVFVLDGGVVTGQPYRFELKTVDVRGPSKAHMRMIWQDVTANSLTWRWQALGPDGAWKDNWVLRYKRRPKSA
jgi:hypothetical protein